MDRTTLTAAFKPLERRGLVRVLVDPADKRGRRIEITDAGRDALAAALPVWRRTHDEVDALVASRNLDGLRADLMSLS
jgi:DNA-binding MarR family transcriptional regulator